MDDDSDVFELNVSGARVISDNGCSSRQFLEQTQVLIHPHIEDFIELSNRLTAAIRRRCPVSFDTATGRWQPLAAGGF